MELTPANSIFRCMPTVLPLRFRRLLNAFAYAVDGVELSYSRLRETALQYEWPSDRETDLRARDRVAIILDAWAMIDHVSRARKLVSQFPWESGKPSAQLNAFVRDTKPAALVRNRLHQLDEAILAGAGAEGHSTMGSVSWVDTRKAGTAVRFVVSSGSGEAAEESAIARPAPGEPGGVSQFLLRVDDHEADIDAMHDSITRFARSLEVSLAASVRSAVLSESEKRKVPAEQLCDSAAVDVGSATFVQFESAASPEQQSFTFAEVKVNDYRIAE